VINARYAYRNRKETRDTEFRVATVVNERHTANDNQILLLDQTGVDWTSVVVKDETQTIVHRRDVDYYLIRHGATTEIRRIPGGQMQNGATLFVDYRTDENASYTFSDIGKTVGLGITLLDRFIDLYSTLRNHRYEAVQGPISDRLRWERQQTVGVRFALDFLTIGAELDDLQSNIVPYYSRKADANAQHVFFDRLSVSARGSAQEIYLRQENEKQRYYDASIQLRTVITEGMDVALEGFYRLQLGRGSDLTVARLRAEWNMSYRNMRFQIGGELFRRLFISEDQKYAGCFVKVIREF